MDAYFTTDDDTWFVPTPLARGPWAADACHGGPPTALMILALEGLGLDDQRLARLTVELVRPVPMAGFSVAASIRRRGRTASLTSVTLADGDGRTCASAQAVHLTTIDLPTPTAPVAKPELGQARPGHFPVEQTVHGLEGFTDSVEVRWGPASGKTPVGPATMWMRTVPIVAGEQPSPLQRLAPLADCGNGISPNVPVTELGCLNPDLTINVVRPPVGDWFASRAATHTSDDGIGVAEAALFDIEGLVARVSQTLVLRPM